MFLIPYIITLCFTKNKKMAYFDSSLCCVEHLIAIAPRSSYTLTPTRFSILMIFHCMFKCCI